MTSIKREQLEVIEVYRFLGEKVYRVRIRDTNIVFNIQADSSEEALDKALKMANSIGLTSEVVEAIKTRKS